MEEKRKLRIIYGRAFCLLFMAEHSEDYELVGLLIDRNADIDAKDQVSTARTTTSYFYGTG